LKEKDVPYMQRTRDYYRAQGYTSDYQWAHHGETDFSKLKKPLNKSRVTVITTAMPDNSASKKMREVTISSCLPPPNSMFTDELSWDKENTHTRDVPSFLPIKQLTALANKGKIGSLSSRFFSLPTEYSQRNTNEIDAPLILKECRKDKVDLALLVPL
jgi:hypothetical protein